MKNTEGEQSDPGPPGGGGHLHPARARPAVVGPHHPGGDAVRGAVRPGQVPRVLQRPLPPRLQRPRILHL